MRGSGRPAVFLAAAACVGIALGAGTPRESDDPTQRVERFEFRAYRDVEKLFDGLSYTPQAWQAGIAEIPRLYLTEAPSGWHDFAPREQSPLTKKGLFFRVLAPLALRANELILQDRARIEWLLRQETLDPQDAVWLDEVALRFGVGSDAAAPLDSAAVGELLRRVDSVPVSLVLAQAAEEIGWGTPRFCAVGSTLLEEWSWTKPAADTPELRATLRGFGFRPFEQPLRAVLGYMHDLNTSEARADFRARRAALRAAGELIAGPALAESAHGDRGAAYVDKLHKIMRMNQLGPIDGATLESGPTVFLVPVGRPK